MNLPIYRAKKIDSDEYVEGYYSPDKNYQEHIHTIFYFDIGDFDVDRKTTTQIDPATLAIHFPDMLDSQGNKIFASLSEDGKGGDKLKYSRMTNKMWCEGKEAQIKTALCKFNASGLSILSILKSKDNDSIEIIGIQE